MNIDIAALQEARLPENGSLMEKHYTFFGRGKALQKPGNMEWALPSETPYSA